MRSLLSSSPKPIGALCALILAFLLLPGAARAEKLTVLLDWFVNPDHGPLIVAQQRGFFAEAGLEVEMIEPADPNDPPRMVAAKKADIAISYQPQLHIQVGAGLPLARFATLVATPLSTLLVLDESPVKTIADLRNDYGVAIRLVCREFVMLSRKLGLFTDAFVAIDGFLLQPQIDQGEFCPRTVPAIIRFPDFRPQLDRTIEIPAVARQDALIVEQPRHRVTRQRIDRFREKVHPQRSAAYIQIG